MLLLIDHPCNPSGQLLFYLGGEAISHLVIIGENLTQKRQQNRHNDGSFRSFAENDKIDGDREKRTHCDVNGREMRDSSG